MLEHRKQSIVADEQRLQEILKTFHPGKDILADLRERYSTRSVVEILTLARRVDQQLVLNRLGNVVPAVH